MEGTTLPILWAQATVASPSPGSLAPMALRRWCSSVTLCSPEPVPSFSGLWWGMAGLAVLLVVAIIAQGPVRALSQLFDLPGHDSLQRVPTIDPLRGSKAHVGELIDSSDTALALFTALTICAYSVVDGIGARLSANPNGYSVWLFIGIAMVMVPYALYRDGRDVIPAMQRFCLRGFSGGALQVLSYCIAICAMTASPIAIVATLRETSVLFGAVIAVVVLKEPLRAARIAAACLIVCGLVLIRVQ